MNPKTPPIVFVITKIPSILFKFFLFIFNNLTVFTILSLSFYCSLLSFLYLYNPLYTFTQDRRTGCIFPKGCGLSCLNYSPTASIHFSITAFTPPTASILLCLIYSRISIFLSSIGFRPPLRLIGSTLVSL